MISSKNGTIRKAFVMSVHPGQEREYEKRHQPIWPELEATFHHHGVVNYSIFLNPATRQLFAYVEFADESQWEAVSRTEVCRRWWSHMSDIMPSHADDSPVSQDMIEVFHFEQ